jgi:hypothetical protein
MILFDLSALVFVLSIGAERLPGGASRPVFSCGAVLQRGKIWCAEELARRLLLIAKQFRACGCSGPGALNAALLSPVRSTKRGSAALFFVRTQVPCGGGVVK